MVARAVMAAFALGALVSCTRSPREGDESLVASPSGWRRVTDPGLVCMVHDRYMGVPQVAVVVDDRRYFAACPGCAERLRNEPAVRVARDPVTGREVDKAGAVLAQDRLGRVLYFASEHSYRRYAGED